MFWKSYLIVYVLKILFNCEACVYMMLSSGLSINPFRFCEANLCYSWKHVSHIGIVFLQISCGHQCSFLCHPGTCSRSNQCERKYTLKCKCKRQKRDVKCKERDSEKLECDDKCKQEQEKKKNVSSFVTIRIYFLYLIDLFKLCNNQKLFSLLNWFFFKRNLHN